MASHNSGSSTAKNGFKNEHDIVKMFNNWNTEQISQQWLISMGYEIKKIKSVEAKRITGNYKADIQIQVCIKLINSCIDIQNIQVKLVTGARGFNQIDKRWVDKYSDLWNMPENIKRILKLYTGEIKSKKKNKRDERRLFMDEFLQDEQDNLLCWLSKKKILIVSDILKGRGKFTAEWMLVTFKNKGNPDWIIKEMNFCMNYFGNGNIEITKNGNVRIGKITMQRKGGDNGEKTANMLQFKIDPSELFQA
jgi:hypothetical protein